MYPPSIRDKKNMAPSQVCNLMLSNVREAVGGVRNSFEVRVLSRSDKSPLAATSVTSCIVHEYFPPLSLLRSPCCVSFDASLRLSLCHCTS
jgi:hypothetical protein